MRCVSEEAKLTPIGVIVTRFAQLGIPVKVTLVPLVVAWEVPEVIPSTAPLLIVTLAEPSKVIDMI